MSSSKIEINPNLVNMKIKFSEVLKRELKHYKLIDVAQATGIPISLLSDWKEGSLPSGKNISKVGILADFFNLSLSEVLFNQRDVKINNQIISQTTFNDGDKTYKITIEKLRRK